jgi:hypothetical protein
VREELLLDEFTATDFSRRLLIGCDLLNEIGSTQVTLDLVEVYGLMQFDGRVICKTECSRCATNVLYKCMVDGKLVVEGVKYMMEVGCSETSRFIIKDVQVSLEYPLWIIILRSELDRCNMQGVWSNKEEIASQRVEEKLELVIGSVLEECEIGIENLHTWMIGKFSM